MNTNYLSYLNFLFSMLRLLKKYKIRKVIATNWYPLGVFLPIVKKLRFIDHVFDFDYFVCTHALEVILPARSRIRRFLLNLCLSGSKNIIAVSEYTKRLLKKMYDINYEKVAVVNGIDIEKYSIFSRHEVEKLKDKYNIKDKKVLLTISSLNYLYKGHDLVIDALQIIRKKVPNICYIIVGDGKYKEYLEDKVKKMGLEDFVIFTGKVSEKELVKFYNLCDIFVMPSGGDEEKGEVEGLGLVYLEANACGKPVIGLKKGGAVDAIVDNETGLLLSRKDPDELSEIILKLLCDEELSNSLGKNGYYRVKKKFDWNVTIQQMLDILEFS